MHSSYIFWFPLRFLLAEKSDEVEFECKSKTGGGSSKDDESTDADAATEPTTRGITISPDEIKDKIKYKVKTTDEGIKINLEYKQEIETEFDEMESKTKFELRFESLVEYRKGSASPTSDGTEAYDWENDEILQTIPLTGWDDIPAVVNDGAGVVSYFTASTSALNMDGSGSGSVSFNFTVSRANQDEHLTANSMKIDMLILDFPWTSTDSYVALMSTLESEKKVKVEYDDEATISESGKAKKAKDVIISFGEEMNTTLGFSTYGSYTWEEEALAQSMTATDAANNTVLMARQGTLDEGANVEEEPTLMVVEENKTIQVIATSPALPAEDDETVQQIAYSFVGSGAHSASEIYWDPSTGVGYEDTSAAFSVVSIMSFAGSMAAALILTAL